MTVRIRRRLATAIPANSRNQVQATDFIWRPRRDLNPRLRREGGRPNRKRKKLQEPERTRCRSKSSKKQPNVSPPTRQEPPANYGSIALCAEAHNHPIDRSRTPGLRRDKDFDSCDLAGINEEGSCGSRNSLHVRRNCHIRRRKGNFRSPQGTSTALDYIVHCWPNCRTQWQLLR